MVETICATVAYCWTITVLVVAYYIHGRDWRPVSIFQRLFGVKDKEGE